MATLTQPMREFRRESNPDWGSRIDCKRLWCLGHRLVFAAHDGGGGRSWARKCSVPLVRKNSGMNPPAYRAAHPSPQSRGVSRSGPWRAQPQRRSRAGGNP